MATTYSTSLKLSLIGDGDQSGIWGQTTNNNLGTLLEQAITGVTSIIMVDANYTLSSFNGVVDEARNAVIVVTGANSTVRDLIPPLVEKIYTIVNNTAGGYAIRVIGATGTGVNVPNGTAALVYCDGTNFYAGLSGTSGNFTVNGVAYAANASITGTLSVGGATTLSGTTTAPTPSYPDNTTKVATTAYVNTAISSAATTPIPSGSVFLLYQASAPTGWTQVTSLDDYALRLVSGTGGTTGGTTAFSSVFANQTVTTNGSAFTATATTLSTTQIPSHTHDIAIYNNFVCNTATIPSKSEAGPQQGTYVSGATGGGGSHTHAVSGTATSSAVTLNVRYANIILCSKN